MDPGSLTDTDDKKAVGVSDRAVQPPSLTPTTSEWSMSVKAQPSPERPLGDYPTGLGSTLSCHDQGIHKGVSIPTRGPGTGMMTLEILI